MDVLCSGAVSDCNSHRAGNYDFAAAFKDLKDNSPRCLRIWNVPDIVPKVLAHSPAMSASQHSG